MSLSAPQAGVATGRLQVDADPPADAQLYVDGFLVGALDRGSSAVSLPAGWHRVQLRASGFETASANVTIDENQTASRRMVLRPIPVR
jgi:hypothetical protein